MKSLPKFIIDFLEHLEVERNRSQKTIENYSFYLRRFLEWFGDKNPSDINSEEIRKYRLWLNRLIDAHGDPLKKNTQNYHLIALRSFLKYLAKRDVKTLSPEKIELMKMPDRDISFLEGSDLNAILEAPLKHISATTLQHHNTTTPQHRNTTTNKPIDSPSLIAFRDKALLELLFSTGLRVSELINLKKEDVNLKKDEFTVIGKGRKARVVFLSEQAKYWVKKYLELRKDFNPCLFVSHDKRSGNKKEIKKYGNKEIIDQPLTARSVQRAVQKYARAAGITKSVTPHTLRHSYATDLLQNGADIRSVQAMLGHSSITTTQIYTHITDKELWNVHKRFHGKERGND
ncbi:MAG: tyrosine-type recombinase/integrase [Patescibacteria group bacterium]